MNSRESIEILALRNELAENNEITAIREKFYQGRILILVKELEQVRNELSFRRVSNG
jgi:hypothetical protein